MSLDTEIANARLDIDGTLDRLGRDVPGMREMAEAFAALASERQALIEAMEDWAGEIAFDAGTFGAGQPLLADLEARRLEAPFRRAADRLLPVIGRVFPKLVPDASVFALALAERPDFSVRCLAATLAADEADMAALAGEAGIGPAALAFFVSEALKPCLRRVEQRLGALADDTHWCKAHCPVCGTAPDTGLLKEAPADSEYLVAKAGRLWLHCPMCGHIWRYVRLVCPNCDEVDHEKLTVLTVAGRKRMRVHACLACHTYLPVLDLTGTDAAVNLDLAPLALLPLDIMAQEKGYHPLGRTAINSLG